MNKEQITIKKLKFLVVLFIALFITCVIIQNISTFQNRNNNPSNDSENSLKTSLVYDGVDIIFREDEVITESIFIMDYASVTIVNSTVIGSIYIFSMGILNIFQGTSITENIILSDFSSVNIDNSTISENVECRDSSTLEMFSSYSPTTKIFKFDSANLTITGCLLDQLHEFGIAGEIHILNSSITAVILNGLSSSVTYIEDSTILLFEDNAVPLNYITGPVSLNLMTFDFTYSTSDRSINLTWIGWDSPIVDGYLNISFQVLVDGQFYRELNGSGFHKSYVGSLIIDFTSAGSHNVSLISIDAFGNNYTSTISIEIIDYPSFQWGYFGIGVISIAAFIILFVIFIRYRQNHGYHSSLGAIFKKELSDSKIKLIVFMIIGALPGIILSLLFELINRMSGSISIDQIRTLINMVLSFFLLYFGVAFSIITASGGVIGAKKNGSLSWFLSKPVRRWEFLWGKTLANLANVVIIMIPTSISLVLSGILFVDEIYIADVLSIGGYIFLIGILSLLALTAISVLCSTLFKKTGLAIFIPILLFMIVPTLTSFLPILVRHEWPLLFSFSYYIERLGTFWISDTGVGLSSIMGPYAELLGFTITTIDLTPTYIVLILSIVSIICLTLSTVYLKKIDIN